MKSILSKKGNFRDDVLYVIISVIGLIFLVYAGVRLYNLSVDQEAKVARERLDVLVEKIENIGERGTIDLQGVGSKESPTWFLVGWNKLEGFNEGKPDRCFGDSCICICNFGKGLLDGTISERKDFGPICKEKGFCRKLDYNALSVSGYVAGLSSFGVAPVSKVYAPVHQNINEFTIRKGGNSLEIQGVNRVQVSKNLDI